MISRKHFDQILADELSGITGAALERFNRYRIEPRTFPCIRTEGFGEEQIYSVAVSGQSLIVFDDVEEEFGVGRRDPDGVLRIWSLYDTLLTCIKCFPDEKYAALEST
jgi:hypothetical protein